MDAPSLTQGAVAQIWNGQSGFEPVLQCVQLKSLSTNAGGQERWRMQLSDGQHTLPTMLATQMVDQIVRPGLLVEGTVVTLKEFLVNEVHGRKIVIALNLDAHAQKPIQGNPIDIQKADQTAPPAAPTGGASYPPPQQQHSYNNNAGAGGGGYGYAQYHQQQAPPPQPHAPPNQGYNNRSWPAGSADSNAGVYNQPPRPNGSSYGGGMGGNQPPRPPGSYNGMGGNYAHQPASHNAGGYNKENMQGGQGGNPYGAKPDYPGHGPPPYGAPPPVSSYGGAPHAQPPGGAFNASKSNYQPRGPINRNEAPVRIIPIKNLNPYINRWTIQARVTGKSEIRRWTNSRGEGTVCSFDVTDAEGGEIRLTAFKEACERFHPIVELGKVYMISKGSLRPARKQFNHLNNEYEIMLENNSTFEPCMEDEATQAIPSISYNFKKIIALESTQKGDIVDVIGVVLTAGSAVTIQRRDGSDTNKRTLTIKDESNGVIELTMWGGHCTNPGDVLESDNQKGIHPIVAVKAARVGEYNGKTLGTIGATQIHVNPDISEAAKLRHWFDTQGGADSANQVRLNEGGSRSDRRIVLSDIKGEQLGVGGKPDYVECIASIKYIKPEGCYYSACSLQRNGRMCQKKITISDDVEGTGWCETCQAKSMPVQRWILQMSIQDHTQEHPLTCFGELGDQILGMTANEFKAVEDMGEVGDVDRKRSDILAGAQFHQWLFKLKVAEDTYQNETRVKTTIIRAQPLQFPRENAALVSKIRAMLDPPQQPYPQQQQQQFQQQHQGYQYHQHPQGHQQQQPYQQHGGGYHTPPPQHQQWGHDEAQGDGRNVRRRTNEFAAY